MAHQIQVHGNLSHAMRDNYNQHGVDEYYKKVASTYRNPFFPGIKKVIWTFMNRWWDEEGARKEIGRTLKVLDMAAGSGEATLCLLEWEEYRRHQSTTSTSARSLASSTIVNGRPLYHSLLDAISSSTPTTFPVRPPFIPPNARRKGNGIGNVDGNGNGNGNGNGAATGAGTSSNSSSRKSISHSFKGLEIIATDPYTVPAYTERTSRPCLGLSFTDLANGLLPDQPKTFDLIFCSFALHLVESPSELFALLYELSNRAEWLVVVAPHKKPEIKETWGWSRWDLKTWKPAGQGIYAGGNSGSSGDWDGVDVDVGGEDGDEKEGGGLDIVIDKVKLRLYRTTTSV